MTKSNIIAVIILITSSILLVTGLTLWLGPAAPSNDTISKNSTSTDKEITAPLAPKQLEAYNVTMTNDKIKHYIGEQVFNHIAQLNEPQLSKMKNELIQLYKEYQDYVHENFEYHEWPEVENHLASFIEFLETGELFIAKKISLE
jgi:hypothetical protein